MPRFLLCLWALLAPVAAAASEEPGRCPEYTGETRVYWGDLHVHTAYSLDAWGYGTIQTPADAYRFAQGGEIAITDEFTVALEEPLDFMAVTDHAEWLGLLYLCTDPEWRDHPYCGLMTERAGRATGGEVFAEYVIPTITQAEPAQPQLCLEDPDACRAAAQSQWQRIQQQTEAANQPCRFTAFHGYEWSGTPDYSHNHRNVIFRNAEVSAQAIDYLRYPSPQRLWRELARQCRAEDGCDAIVIPHNTNMGDGKSFVVEAEDAATLALRARYETLVEIHQEKGSSECLYAFGQPDEDCGFELFLTRNSRPTEPEGFAEAEWRKMGSTYVRALLGRGLRVFQETGVNPLQLGIVGATDNHAATGGLVEEEQWPGSVFGLGSLERTMTRLAWNPGGLTGIWAEENTRDSLFDALKRREVFATSGPRIKVRLDASLSPLDCGAPAPGPVFPMGSELTGAKTAPYFMVRAQRHRTPLQSIELVKVDLHDGQRRKKRVPIWRSEEGEDAVCQTWQDAGFDPASPALWYARIKEAPTLRWSAHHCRSKGRCDDFPGADVQVQERAWTSPIWHLP